MENNWRIVAKDGNPEKAGVYPCIVIYPVWNGEQDTGIRRATLTSRFFGDAEKYSGWIMSDQPETGLVWTEESGSVLDERVYAWREMELPKDLELPEGVEWDMDV